MQTNWELTGLLKKLFLLTVFTILPDAIELPKYPLPSFFCLRSTFRFEDEVSTFSRGVGS